jgi:serine O-acetyltransferase
MKASDPRGAQSWTSSDASSVCACRLMARSSRFCGSLARCLLLGCLMTQSIHQVDSCLPARSLVPERAPTPSAVEPDWSRECLTQWWDPSRQLIRALRDYARAERRCGLTARPGRTLAVLRHRFWSIVSGADIPLNTYLLGGGLLLPHPQGVVIHPEARIGPNCLLLQQVTIGTGPRPGLPALGGHVDVGAGAKILGGVVIGEHAVIGANAVVIADVPAHAVAVGVPATIAHQRCDPARQRPPERALVTRR